MGAVLLRWVGYRRDFQTQEPAPAAGNGSEIRLRTFAVAAPATQHPTHTPEWTHRSFAATDEIMNAIHGLTGQNRADSYNETPPADTIEKLKRAVFQRERL